MIRPVAYGCWVALAACSSVPLLATTYSSTFSTLSTIPRIDLSNDWIPLSGYESVWESEVRSWEAAASWIRRRATEDGHERLAIAAGRLASTLRVVIAEKQLGGVRLRTRPLLIDRHAALWSAGVSAGVVR